MKMGFMLRLTINCLYKNSRETVGSTTSLHKSIIYKKMHLNKTPKI